MHDLLSELIFHSPNTKSIIIEKLQNSNYPIYLFGDAEYALVVKKFLNNKSINVSGNIVSRENILYLNNEKINNLNFSFHLVIGIADESKAKDILSNFELKNCLSVDYFSLNPFYNIDKDMIVSSWNKISSVLSSLNDSISKEIFINYLKSGLSFDSSLLFSKTPQYFPPFLEFTNKEVVVDGGSYIGDTLSDYIHHNKSFSEYYAYEPSLFNYNILKSFSENIINCTTFNKGLGMSNSKLIFHDENVQSSTSSFIPNLFNSNNLKEVEIVRLDDEINYVSFIKLDIEGAEFHALIGSANLISKFKPKIAVCIYHKFEHLWEILDLLKSLRNDYKFSIGYHSTTKILTELVLYAY